MCSGPQKKVVRVRIRAEGMGKRPQKIDLVEMGEKRRARAQEKSCISHLGGWDQFCSPKAVKRTIMDEV